MTTQHTILATELGELTIVRDGDRLTGLYFPHHWYRPAPASFGPRTGQGFGRQPASWPSTSPATGPPSTFRSTRGEANSSSGSGT